MPAGSTGSNRNIFEKIKSLQIPYLFPADMVTSTEIRVSTYFRWAGLKLVGVTVTSCKVGTMNGYGLDMMVLHVNEIKLRDEKALMLGAITAVPFSVSLTSWIDSSTAQLLFGWLGI